MNLHSTKYVKVMTMVVALFFVFETYAQTSELGTASILNVQLNYNKHWSTYFETQFRSDRFFSNFNFDEFKVGANYNLADKIAISVGNGVHNTYALGGNFKKPMVNKEYRLWEQFVLYNTIGKLKLEHRYRIEQRWMTQGFRNRFRYRLNAIVSLNKPKIVKGGLYAYINDEIYLTDKPGYFQRNRLYVGGGYRLLKQLTIQMGYLHQFDNLVSRTASKDFLQTTLLVNVHSHRSIRELHPAITE